MTCTHCCGAEKIFDSKEASKKLRHYLRKGPRKTTRRLLMAIGKENMQGKTLLDIGGGVGAIQHELLAKGLRSTTDVDASLSYINAAKEISIEKGMTDRMEFVYGDFLDIYPTVERHDVVTLEKVVCCYPNVKDLINSSASRSEEVYGLVYPMDNWLSRLTNKIGNIYLWITKNSFRSFVHRESMINSLIVDNGFERVHYSAVFPWRVAVYKRVAPVG